MIYLDNSATTKQYPEVTELMVKYMDEYFGNPSSLYQLGLDSERAIKKARRQVEEAIGIGNGKVYFTSGGTEADNMAIFGAAKALRRAGNKIVTSKVEHPAVLECCKRLEGEGFEVVYIDVDKNCRLDIQRLEAAVDERTILVSLMHVNNETGTIMPVDKIKPLMKAKSSPGFFHCDAVQSFGKLPAPKDADLISISSHKIHGPKGVGALYVRNGVNLPEFISGGGQEEGKRSGTENVPAIAGFGLAAEICSRSMEEETRRMSEMRRLLLTSIRDNIDNVLVNSVREDGSDEGNCCPSLLSVSFAGTRGEVLLHTLEQEGIYVSTGSACSSNKKGRSHVLSAMGLNDKEIEGTLRFSLGRFNYADEMEKAAERIAAAVKRFRKLGSFR